MILNCTVVQGPSIQHRQSVNSSADEAVIASETTFAVVRTFCLFCCRVFQPTKNGFMDSLQSILDDVKWSLLFLVLTMWGFAGAFYILFREDQADYVVRATSDVDQLRSRIHIACAHSVSICAASIILTPPCAANQPYCGKILQNGVSFYTLLAEYFTLRMFSTPQGCFAHHLPITHAHQCMCMHVLLHQLAGVSTMFTTH